MLHQNCLLFWTFIFFFTKTSCSTVHDECPDGFTEVEDYCYKITEKNVAPPNCPFSDTVSFEFALSVLESEQTTTSAPTTEVSTTTASTAATTSTFWFTTETATDSSFWSTGSTSELLTNATLSSKTSMFLKIRSSVITEPVWVPAKRIEDFGFIRWYEVSPNYGKELYIDSNDNVLKKNCVIYENEEYKAVSCDEEYASLCVYKNTMNNFYAKYQNNTINKTVSFKESKVPTLEFKVEKDQLILEVSNTTLLKILTDYMDGQEYSIFCFFDSTQSTFFNIIAYSKDFEIVFASNKSYPGYYQCQAFQNSDLTLIETKKYFFKTKDNYEFVGVFNITYNSILNPLSSTMENYLWNFFNFISIEDFTFRLMKIVAVDQDANSIQVNIHFSSKFLLNDTSVTNLFNSVQNKIENCASHRTDVILINFLSSDYCIERRFDNFTFSTQKLNSVMPSLPLCVFNDGFLMNLACQGNFIDGASWGDEFNNKCEILPSSNITSLLLSMYLEFDLQLEEIYSELKKYDVINYSSADFYLLVDLLGNSTKECESFSSFVRDLTGIEKTILLQAQNVARSVDKLLEIIDDYLSNSNQDNFTQLQSNFGIDIDATKQDSGIVIKCEDSNCYINQILGNCSEDEVLEKYGNFEFAVWLSPGLRISSVAFTTFLGYTFFGQIPENITIENVFGVHVPSEVRPLGYFKILKKSTLDEFESCMLYNYTSSKWINTYSYDRKNNISSCTFWNGVYVAFAYNSSSLESEVTDDLQDLLNSDVNDVVKIGGLAVISQRFSDFQEQDVSLVGEILNGLTDNTMELHPLAETVSNLHKIEKTVLLKSQKKHKALDKVLKSTDSILKNSKIVENFLSFENFFVVTSTNMSGVVLLQKNDTFEVQVLSGSSSIAEITKSDNIISFVFLSSELRNQLPKNSKIIITVFVSDTLFYEESEDLQKSVSTVFGVILPEIGNYSGPIIIEHNISASNKVMYCSHWNYGSSTNKSFWGKDIDGVQSENFLKCEFWHTTHFALLLLESDLYDDGINFWITTISSFMSLIGLCIIFLTGILFENWRRKLGNQILLNFSFAITLEIIMFYFGSFFKTPSSIFCTIVGIFLQYSIMSQFSWALIVAVIQFRRFVIVFVSSPRNFLIKCCLCGWGLPLIPVLYTLGLSSGTYTNLNGLCYPTGLSLYLGVWLPILVISAINLIIFIYIVVYLLRASSARAEKSILESKHQTRLFVMLFFILGLTWCFGFLAFFKLGMIFSYIFNGTTTLQGFFLFLYYIVLNSNTRRMYVGKYYVQKKCAFYKNC